EVSYKEGRFRKDLFFRLNVVAIQLPPLRERRSDIPTLVHYFLNKFSPKKNMQVSQAAMNALLAYEWPGNVRELENCMERAVALGTHNFIEINDLPPAIGQGSGEPVGETRVAANDLSGTDLEELERTTIQRVFEETNGDKALTGRMLGISRAT